KTYLNLGDVVKDFPETTNTYKMAERIFEQNPRPSRIAILGVQYNAGEDTPDVLVDALDENKEQDFYFLLCEEQGEDEVIALAQWVKEQKRIYFYSTDNPTIHEGLNSDR